MMTKSEFDELFKNGDLVIEHHTMEEWKHIRDYVRSIGLTPNTYGILYGHDPVRFPFAGFRVYGGGLTAFCDSMTRRVVPYVEFAAIIGEEPQSEFKYQIDLEEIL